MKKLLVLENEHLSHNDKEYVTRFDGEVIIVDKLRYSTNSIIKLKEILVNNIITDIFFSTTWLYRDTTFKLYNIIKKLSYSVNFWISSGNDNPCYKILDAIQINTRKEYDEYLSLKKHNFYLIYPYGKFGEDFTKHEWILKDEILDEFLEKIEDQEIIEEDKKNIDNLISLELENIMKTSTNHYVKICNIEAFGSEWNNLKKDDIVPVLKTPSSDKSPLWGVWVAGKTEPVKLLNSDFKKEFSYMGILQENKSYKLNCKGLAKEMISSIYNTGLDKNTMISMLAIKINRKLGLNKYENNLHAWLTYEILDFAEIPRRHYRAYFEEQLNKYYKDHTFFKELNSIDEPKI